MKLYAGIDLHSNNNFLVISQLKGDKVKKLTVECLKKYFTDETIFIAAQSNLFVMQCIDDQVKVTEKSILTRAKLKDVYEKLLTVDGIGKYWPFR